MKKILAAALAAFTVSMLPLVTLGNVTPDASSTSNGELCEASTAKALDEKAMQSDMFKWVVWADKQDTVTPQSDMKIFAFLADAGKKELPQSDMLRWVLFADAQNIVVPQSDMRMIPAIILCNKGNTDFESNMFSRLLAVNVHVTPQADISLRPSFECFSAAKAPQSDMRFIVAASGEKGPQSDMKLFCLA